MRMRKKKHGAERIQACAELLFTSREDLPKLPVHLEIGCGKGAFITQLAQQNPDIFYLAVEKYSDVAMLAMEKAQSMGLQNVRFFIGDAVRLTELLHPGDAQRIYLNFSDPWPKKGHAKRRLTYRSFLAIYQQLLCEGGAVAFKTDNRGLFDFSLEEMQEFGYTLTEITYDLHHSEYNEGNIRTEYETNFSEKGFPIHRVVAYPPKKEHA